MFIWPAEDGEAASTSPLVLHYLQSTLINIRFLRFVFFWAALLLLPPSKCFLLSPTFGQISSSFTVPSATAPLYSTSFEELQIAFKLSPHHSVESTDRLTCITSLPSTSSLISNLNVVLFKISPSHGGPMNFSTLLTRRRVL